MKKTLSINLNGRVFNIDEDAYKLLENYLTNLKSYFGNKPDTEEIISDFEARIEELFSEKIKSGYEVITIAHVEAVIACMGNPEDLGEETAGMETKKPATDNSQEHKSKKKFYRNVDDKKLGGVCSGIATYFGWDVSVVRLAFVILALLSMGWFSVFYVVLWLVMPEAVTASQKLEMKGEPVTLENIGKTVSETIASVKTSEIENILTTIFKVWAIVFCCLIGFPLMIVFFALVVALIAMLLGAGSLFFIPFDFLGITPIVLEGHYPIIAVVSLLVIVGMPLFSIVHAIFFRTGKSSSSSKGIKLFSFFVWIIAVITFLISGIQFAKQQDFEKIKIHFPWGIHCDSSKIIIEKSGNMPLKLEDTTKNVIVE